MSKIFSKLVGLFKNSSTLRDIATLVGGTGMAQVVTFLGYMVLTRIYSPSDMGVLSLVLSLAALGTVVATGRYDQAVMLPDTNREARVVVSTAVSITLAFTALFAVISVFLYPVLSKDYPALAPYLPVVALLAGAGALTSTWTQWLSRCGRYRQISLNRLSASILSIIFQIGLWLAHLGGVFGVVIGRAFGVFGACFTLSLKARDARILKTEKSQSTTETTETEQTVGTSKTTETGKAAGSGDAATSSIVTRRQALYRYRKMPLLNGMAAIFDSARINGINLLIAAFFTTATLGQFSLAWQMVQAPLTLINAALAQVYFRQLARTPRGQLFALVKKVTWRCAAVGFLPFLALAVLSPWLVPLIFGHRWQMAGYFTQALCLWLYINLVSSPISTVFITTETQQVSAIFAFFFMILPFALLFFAHLLSWSMLVTLWSLSTLMACLLIVFIALAWWIAARFDTLV